MEKFNQRKAVQLLAYLAQKEGGIINNAKSMILIWLSDRLHLRTYGRTITGDEYFAHKNGISPIEIKKILIDNKIDDIDSVKFIGLEDDKRYKIIREINRDVFSLTDFEILDIIYDNFGNMDEYQLIEVSKNFKEWKKYSYTLDLYPDKTFHINKLDFFSNDEEQYDIFKEPDSILNIIKEIFIDFSFFL